MQKGTKKFNSALSGYCLSLFLFVVTMMANTEIATAHDVSDISFTEAMDQRDVARLSTSTLQDPAKAYTERRAHVDFACAISSTTAATVVNGRDMPTAAHGPALGCRSAATFFRLDSDDVADDLNLDNLTCMDNGHVDTSAHGKMQTLVDCTRAQCSPLL